MSKDKVVVKLDRIYTRGGDQGMTTLGDGTKVSKAALRVRAYGTVDEANATIGLARLYTEGEADELLARIQNDLLDLGADLSVPQKQEARTRLRIEKGHVERLEKEIDAMTAELPALTSFLLPGGSPASAHLHSARTVVRRAEQLSTGLLQTEPVNPLATQYLNRLADHLFTLARWLNDKGASDVLWVPGAHR